VHLCAQTAEQESTWDHRARLLRSTANCVWRANILGSKVPCLQVSVNPVLLESMERQQAAPKKPIASHVVPANTPQVWLPAP
jgi:hypothetical protein